MDTENIREEIEPESIFSQINGEKAMIAQMERMIEENHRQIALGDDVKGRERLITVLTDEIENHKRKIAQLEAQVENQPE